MRKEERGKMKEEVRKDERGGKVVQHARPLNGSADIYPPAMEGGYIPIYTGYIPDKTLGMSRKHVSPQI